MAGTLRVAEEAPGRGSVGSERGQPRPRARAPLAIYPAALRLRCRLYEDVIVAGVFELSAARPGHRPDAHHLPSSLLPLPLPHSILDTTSTPPFLRGLQGPTGIGDVLSGATFSCSTRRMLCKSQSPDFDRATIPDGREGLGKTWEGRVGPLPRPTAPLPLSCRAARATPFRPPPTGQPRLLFVPELTLTLSAALMV